MDFKVHNRTVCYFVSDWENSHNDHQDKGHDRLEHQECFLQGLKLLFHQAKGIPRKIRIDNLTLAVRK